MKNSIHILLLVQIFIFTGCPSPDTVKKSLESITPESQGISSQAILNFIEAADNRHKDELHSFMLLRYGNIIAQGWWAPYNPESPHQLYSLSKSFTSSAIGIAQDEGLLSIDETVLSFFPDDAPDSISVNLRSMRIRDLLKMNTGHNADATGRMRKGGDSWVEGFLALPVEHKPGTHFVYNSAATYMLSAIIQKVTGETLLKYLTPRLFEPLGISNPSWESDPDGINLGGWGLNIRTKDIAGFGQLYLQKGNWNGKQLISKEWIEEATSYQTSNGSNPDSDWEQGYGYQFWLCRHNIYRGDGAFGQYCIIMPEHDAVIAITSGTNDMQSILNLIWEYLLPSFQTNALPEDEKCYSALQNKLSQLNLSTVTGEKSSPTAFVISEKPYTMETNDAGIKTIIFDLSGNDNSFSFTNEEGSQKVPVGYGSTKKGIVSFPQLGEQVVATSGAWTSKNNYRVKMHLYETPFFITFDFLFGDNILTVQGERNVSLGSEAFLQMKGETQ